MLVGEFRLVDGTADEAAESLDEIQRLVREARAVSPRPVLVAKRARELTDAIAEGQSPLELLELLAAPKERHNDLKAQVSLGGKLEHAESAHWDAYAFGRAGRLRVEQVDMDSDSACAAVVRMTRPDAGHGSTLHRADVATAAAAFAKSVSSAVSVVLVVQPDESGVPVNARLAVRHQGHTGMTVEFNPHTPSPLVLLAIQQIQGNLLSEAPVSASGLADAVSPTGVQKAFYTSVSDWVLRQYALAQGVAAGKRRHKEAVLRHLIRTLFVWVLKEGGHLPETAFDPVFTKRHAPGRYHKEVLGFLFHERLNKPNDQRRSHSMEEIDEELSGVSFLNGSLFAVHEGDADLFIEDEAYFGNDPGQPGLFTILSDYDWTDTEHIPEHSDQAIDPVVLGSLFENLIAVTEAEETPKRMPNGTYYTPPDVAQEMVKDALMLATRHYAPAGWPDPEQDLLTLFGDPNTPLPPGADKNDLVTLADRIRKLAVFDPCVGSGVFLVSVLHSMRFALAKLGHGDKGAQLTRQIITEQLHAQDIHPMAVQITRLRLFLALVAAEVDGLAGPLPNLEARVVCADTLCTDARRDWEPSATGTLDGHQSGVIEAVRARLHIFSRWQHAHKEAHKQQLRDSDENARKGVQAAIQEAAWATPETEAFANHRLLDPDAGPALTDARLLFHKPDWAGFDLVIGNPPYLSFSNYSKEAGKDAKKRLVRRATRLKYQTLKCQDQYTLMTEATLTLTAPDNGVLTLIVPLSLCFGQKQARLRELLETDCSEIRVRCQDNRPDTTFKKNPVTNPENRQRTTILSAVCAPSPSKPRILVTGTSKWRKGERHVFLEHRQYTRRPDQKPALDERLDRQWERIPTPETREMILAMRAAQTRIHDLQRKTKGTERIGFPLTAYEFITITPAGRLTRGELIIEVGSQDSLKLAMAAANSHPAYAWWKTYGDAYHVNGYTIKNIAVPDSWIKHQDIRQRILDLGSQLISAVKLSNIKSLKSGTKGTQLQSLNFHDCEPDTIAEIDELYVDGLKLKGRKLNPQPLLDQLHTLRTNSNWQIG